MTVILAFNAFREKDLGEVLELLFSDDSVANNLSISARSAGRNCEHTFCPDRLLLFPIFP